MLTIWLIDLLAPNQIQRELSSPRFLSFLVNFKSFYLVLLATHCTKLCEIDLPLSLVNLRFHIFTKVFWTTFHVLHLHHHHHHHRVFMDCPIEYRPPSSRDDGSQCHVFCKNLCQRYTSRPRTTSNITK